MRVTHLHRESPETTVNLSISDWEAWDEPHREESPARFISHAHFWLELARAADIIMEHRPAGIKAEAQGKQGKQPNRKAFSMPSADSTVEEPAQGEEDRSLAGRRTQSSIERRLEPQAQGL